MIDHEAIVKIKEAAEKQLLGLPGVTGVAVGVKQVGGKRTNEMSILVYVNRKKAIGELSEKEKIPPVIGGIRTDVIESGHSVNIGVYTGGIEIESGNGDGQGTLGGFAMTREATPRAVLLTCQHVVMRGVATTPLGDDVGPTICSVCSPCCSKIMGQISAAVLTPQVDGAVALLNGGIQLLREIPLVGIVRGVHPVTTAEAGPGTYPVKMYSRMQERLVTGTVESINYSGNSWEDINHTRLHRAFQNQIHVKGDPGSRPFAIQGDSGSLLFNTNNEVVGLIYGSDLVQYSSASPITDVQDQLHIDIAVIASPGQVFTVPASGTAHTAGPGLNFGPARAGAGISLVEPAVSVAAASGSLRAHRLNQLYAKIQQVPLGIKYDLLYHRHMDEIRRLVNTNKRVATTWHRNQGPAFLAHLSNSLLREDYRIPETVRAVTLVTLLENMAAILTRYGGASLQEDIATHLEELLGLVSPPVNAEKIISKMTNTDQTWPAQEHWK